MGATKIGAPTWVHVDLAAPATRRRRRHGPPRCAARYPRSASQLAWGLLGARAAGG